MATKKRIYQLISPSAAGTFLSTSKSWLMKKAAELGFEDPLIGEVYYHNEDVEDDIEYGYKYTGIANITITTSPLETDIDIDISDTHWKFTDKPDDDFDDAILIRHCTFYLSDSWSYYVSFYSPKLLTPNEVDSQLKDIAFKEFDKSRKEV